MTNQHPDLSAAQALALQIEQLFRNRPVDNDHSETLTALMISIGGELLSIDCDDCRKLAARNVKKMLPGVIASALAQRASVSPMSHQSVIIFTKATPRGGR